MLIKCQVNCQQFLLLWFNALLSTGQYTAFKALLQCQQYPIILFLAIYVSTAIFQMFDHTIDNVLPHILGCSFDHVDISEPMYFLVIY